MLGFLIVHVLLCIDRPDPPTNLELSDPYERSVRLSWVPGDSNHNPITGKSQKAHKHFFNRVQGLDNHKQNMGVKTSVVESEY